jgi:Flp pilus assembly protein TadD
VQAVAWIPGRNDSLLALFAILTILSYLNFNEKRTVGLLLLHLCWFALALLSKETAFILPALLLSLNFLVSRKTLFSKDNIKMYLGWCIVFVPWYFVREMVAYRTSLGQFNFLWEYYLHNLAAVPLFIGKIFLPVNLSTYPILEDSTLGYGIVTGVLLILLLIKSRKKYPQYVWFGGLWFVLFLLPPLMRVNPVVTTDFLEHRIYVPMIGILFMLLAIDYSTYLKNYGNVKMILSVTAIVVLLIFTIKRSQHYKDGWNYWTEAVTTSPHAAVGHQGLADIYTENGMYSEALKEFQQAAFYEPNRPDVHYDMGVAYDRLGYVKEAEQSYRKAIQLYSEYLDAYQNLAVILDKQGMGEEANIMFVKALELNPNSYELHNNYGIHLSKRNLLTEAEKEFRRAIVLNPQYGNAHLNLGYLYYVQQKSDSAERHFDIAQKLGVPVPAEFFVPSTSSEK